MGGSKPPKVAIVGGGLTGIASFWALQGSGLDVHLFEASPALGGHMKTVLLENSGNKIQVDTELPTFNPNACPNLSSLLHYLGVFTTAVPFSFGVLDDTSVFRWRISILRSILLSPRILCKLETYRVLLDAISLRCFGADVLTSPTSDDAVEDSTEGYLSQQGYCQGFRDRYLTPLLSTLWRTNAGRFLPSLPFRALARSLSDHQLLSTCEATPKWRRIDPGVNHLIETMTRHFPCEKLHFQTKVDEITRRSKSQYDLVTSEGKHSHFDHVILTVDGHEILRLLDSTANAEEMEVLHALGVTRNIAVLHSGPGSNIDTAAPGSNFIMASRDTRRRDVVPPKSCLRYDVNTLQDIPSSRFGEVFITLNSLTPPHPSLVQGVWEFTEPEPSASSLHAQSLLPSIQNTRSLSYGYCWTGRGLLEDAITSGFRMAVEHLGAAVPFPVVFHPQPLDTAGFECRRAGIRHHLVRTTLQAIRALVLVLEITFLLLARVRVSHVWCWGKG
ncbi:uncharacterized protein BDV17DRAFT_174062 [Aspergillus undulatus]|uniref:uncharacterized protein n=1 Tax=Aspergillus undulatus TaxID=1810928 RepID=UPI003CCD8D82